MHSKTQGHPLPPRPRDGFFPSLFLSSSPSNLLKPSPSFCHPFLSTHFGILLTKAPEAVHMFSPFFL